MQRAIKKLKPNAGFSHIFHVGILALLPVVLFVLVRLGDYFVSLALGLVLLSKWRMFAVKPRFWLGNIRANAVDILVGMSIVLFMAHSANFAWQIAWAAGYMIWLTVIKPGSSVLFNALQAMIALLLSMMALFMVLGDAPLLLLVLTTGVICYSTAYHFLAGFDEPYAKFLANTWAFMGGAITWILGHWLLYYGILAQPTLIIVALGYGLGGLYYFDHHDRLSRIIKLEFAFIVGVVLVVNVIALAISGASGSIL